MYYIFDDNSGKYLSIKKERLPRRGKTIIAIHKVEKKADATAFVSRAFAEQTRDELNEHGADKMKMDLMISDDTVHMQVMTIAEAIEIAVECGLITDKDSYKAFGAFWALLHGEG